MKVFSAAISTIIMIILIVAVCPASGAGPSSCLICHNSMSGSVTTESGQTINIRIDASRYEASVHGFMSCADCHKKFDENPHIKPSEKVSQDILMLSEKISLKAKVDPIAYSACNDCHGETYNHVLSSPHGENIVTKKESDGALCLDCHGSPHYIVKSDNPASPVTHANVVETCGHCHGDKELTKKYGIETNVLTSYTESFHGKKHHLGHRKVPTCVNCHGYHDIKRKDDPASPVFATNKKKTCGACHKGANDKFVAAITHKPVGPIPHYTEIALILLTLGVFSFIVLHVLLEAYSDIRDAVFRRKRRSVKDESGKECA